MGVFTAIEAAISVISAGASIIGRSEQAAQQEKAVNLELQQEQLANTERSTQRTRRLNEVLANQTAEAGARGLSASSGSLFAIGADSINQFAQDQNADAINLSFDKINAANKKRNIKSNEIWGDAGSVINLGANLYEGSYSAGLGAKEPYGAGSGATEGPDVGSPAVDSGAAQAGRGALGEPL